MIGARALLALAPNYERDPEVPSAPSEDALLGALMTAESQAATVIIAKILLQLFK